MALNMEKHVLWLVLGYAGTAVAAGTGFYFLYEGYQEHRAEEANLKAALLEYLPEMTKAYGDGDLEPLRPYTVEKEIARMYKRISDLAAEGKRVEPELKSLTIEEIYMWGGGMNATVTF